MEQSPAPENDGEILVIEVDGKATLTDIEKVLEKRRSKRKNNKSFYSRHRGKDKRKNYH